jgi:hypothetical protein
MKKYKRKMEPEELRQLLELRRSSASSKHRNKKKYCRTREKAKHYVV